MKKRRIVAILCAALLALTLIMGYASMPDNIILYENREWENTVRLQHVENDKSIEASGDALVPRKAGNYEAALSLFGIPYKSVTLTILEDKEVIAGGQAVGIRLYSKGLVVVAVGRVNEKGLSPAQEAGIRVGDVIEKINGEEAVNPEKFSQAVECCERVTLSVARGEKSFDVDLEPVRSEYDGVKRIGVWVRDSTAGVGTLTYVDPESRTYGALGHGVSDVDTGVRFNVYRGSIEPCIIGEIIKGEKGSPGELKGIFYSAPVAVGNILKNENEGIFGQINATPEGKRVKLGHKSEIKKGKAYIRTSLDGKIVKDYEIEIVKVSPNSKNATKGIVLKVTDEELIEKTGGIVQGMSGSPIIQEERLIGAVTHVFVNDPVMGYGIFIENMLAEAEKIK